MERMELQGNLRTETGKGGARQLRREGRVPAIVYGSKGNTMLSLNTREMSRVLSKMKSNTILNLKVGDKKEKMVVVKELQKNVVSRDLLHVDLLEISMDKKLKLSVPIKETGKPIGIKLGGILTHLLRELRIECLPADIPESIEIDVSSLDIGHNLHVQDIEAPKGVAIMNSPEEVICAVNLPEAEKSKEAEEGEVAEGAEGTPPEAGEASAEDGKEKAGEDKDKDKEKKK